jgi:hypothetical protein
MRFEGRHRFHLGQHPIGLILGQAPIFYGLRFLLARQQGVGNHACTLANPVSGIPPGRLTLSGLRSRSGDLGIRLAERRNEFDLNFDLRQTLLTDLPPNDILS